MTLPVAGIVPENLLTAKPFIKNVDKPIRRDLW